MDIFGPLLTVAQNRDQLARTFREADITEWRAAHEGAAIVVRFVYQGRRVAYAFPLRTLSLTVRAAAGKTTVAVLSPETDSFEMRRMWRAVVWLLRGKLYAVYEGIRTLEQEFAGDFETGGPETGSTETGGSESDSPQPGI